MLYRAYSPKQVSNSVLSHQIRNSIKHVGSKHQKEFLWDLKTVYGAVSKETAETQLDALDNKWGETYPIVKNHGVTIGNALRNTPAIRKLIYNTIEGYHRQVHKVTKNTTCKLVSDITTISNKIWRTF